MRNNKAPQKPVGRQTTITLGRITALTNLLAAGNYIKTAAQFIGLSESGIHRWRDRGERELDRVASKPGVELDYILESFEGKDYETLDKNGEPVSKSSPEWMWSHRPEEFDDPVEWPFVIVAIQIEKSRAAAEVRILHTIHSAAASGNWQAGAWWLERTFPDRYGRVDRLKLGGDQQGTPIRVETTITVDQLDEALDGILDDDGQH